MGSCCSSRTDVDGNTKTGSKSGSGAKSGTTGGTAKGGKTTKDEGVKFSPMDQVKNTINSVLRDSK